MQDLSINAFIFKEISDCGHDDNEKTFLRNLLLRFLNVEEATDSLFCGSFSDFIEGRKIYQNDAQEHFTSLVEKALDNTGLKDLSARLIRTVELLGSRKSLSPIVDSPELWQWYEGSYYHKHNRDFIRESLDSPIMGVLDVYNFPSHDYKYYQGYTKHVEIKDNSFILDPYRKPWQHYYALPMKREMSLEQNLGRPGMQIPEKYTKEEWLTFRRAKYLELKEKRLCQK